MFRFLHQYHLHDHSQSNSNLGNSILEELESGITLDAKLSPQFFVLRRINLIKIKIKKRKCSCMINSSDQQHCHSIMMIILSNLMTTFASLTGEPASASVVAAEAYSGASFLQWPHLRVDIIKSVYEEQESKRAVPAPEGSKFCI